MTLIVTLFVTTQLFFGFCAMLAVMRQSKDIFQDETELHPIRIHRANRR